MGSRLDALGSAISSSMKARKQGVGEADCGREANERSDGEKNFPASKGVDSDKHHSLQ